MERDRLQVVVVAVLAVLALAAAAATLDSATSTGGGMGPSDTGGSGFDDDDGESVLPLGGDDSGGLLPGDQTSGIGCWDLLQDPRVITAVLLVVVLVAAFLHWRYDEMATFAFVFAFVIPAAVFYMLFAACPSANDGERGFPGGGGDPPEGGGMLGDEIGRAVPDAPSLLLLVLLVGAFVMAAVVLVRGTDDEEIHEPEAPEEPDDRAAAVAAAAGRAADRIEADGDLENEIYRAWREMVGLLDVSNPRATTPGEFADAAAAAGMTRSDVDELTDLFEAVRYGGFDPTDERERRAIEALRRIEREYEEGAG